MANKTGVFRFNNQKLRSEPHQNQGPSVGEGTNANLPSVYNPVTREDGGQGQGQGSNQDAQQAVNQAVQAVEQLGLTEAARRAIGNTSKAQAPKVSWTPQNSNSAVFYEQPGAQKVEWMFNPMRFNGVTLSSAPNAPESFAWKQTPSFGEDDKGFNNALPVNKQMTTMLPEWMDTIKAQMTAAHTSSVGSSASRNMLVLNQNSGLPFVMG